MSYPAKSAQAVNIVTVPFEKLSIFGVFLSGGVLHDQFAQVDIVDDCLRNTGQECVDSIRHDAGSWFVDVVLRFFRKLWQRK
ncbi:hypothetical protein D3C72_2311440 [compost metagenome]